MDEGNVVVIDNLASSSKIDALSARQGRVLNEKIAASNARITNIETAINNVATDEDIDAIFVNNSTN